MSATQVNGVDELHDGSPAHPFVTAVLIARDAHQPWLDATVTAVCAQTRRPDRLVIVDGSAAGRVRGTLDAMTRERADLRALDLTVVTASHDEAFAALVDRAVQALPVRSSDHVVALRTRRRARRRESHPNDRYNWLWLLHEDSAPLPTALAAQLRAAGRSELLGILGCKIHELDRSDRLVNVGIDVTTSGRHVARTHDGELDQGQHDLRRDVLAVASSGMLVRQDVYLELGGFDPAFDGDGDGLDLCWRAHLAGHAVAVIPDAVAHQDLDAAHLLRSVDGGGSRPTRRERRALSRRAGDPDRPAPHSAATLRRHRQVALARTPAWRLPFAMVWTTLTSLLLALALLLVKRPRRAAAELGQASASFGLARIFGARRRFRGRAVVSTAQLRSLFVPASVGRARAWEAFVEAVTPSGSRTAGASPASSETGPTSQDAEYLTAPRGIVARGLRHPGLWLFLALVALSAVLARRTFDTDLLSGGAGLAGGALEPSFTSASAWWHAWRDAWQGDGYGHPASSAPYLPFLAAGAWLVSVFPWTDDAASAQAALTWLFLAAPVLAGLAAYWAGRVVTRRPWPRAVVALLWGSAAPLTGAMADGRLGALVAAIMVPLTLAGLAAIARRSGGAGAVAACALAATVLVAFAPPFLPALTVLLLVIVVFGRRAAKWRALAVAVLVPLLLGHWSVEVWRHPARLVAGPGTLTQEAATDPVAMLFAHPGGPGSTPLVLGIPVLLAGLFGAVRGRSFAAARWVLVGGALASLGAAMIVPRHSFGANPGWHVWAGLPLLAFVACLLALALVAAGETTVPRTRRAARGTPLRWATAGTVLVTVGTAACAAWTSPTTTRLMRVEDPLPAIAAHEAHSARAALVLELHARADAVDFTVRSREAGLPAADAGVPAMRTPAAVTRAIGSLTDAAADRSDAARALREAGVAYVSATQEPGARSLELDGVDGLTPMASTAGTSLYHVDGEGAERAARVVVTDGENRTIVPVSGDHARVSTTLPAGAAARRVAVAAGPGFAEHASVTLDGRPLRHVAGDLPTYELGAAGGRLEIDPGTAWRGWRWAQLGLFGVVAFLALPFGTRKKERA